MSSRTGFGPRTVVWDRRSQPSQRGCHVGERGDQPYTFCRRFGTASISTGSSACTRSVFRCVWPHQNEY